MAKGKAVTPKRARELEAWADATLRPPPARGLSPMPDAMRASIYGPSDRADTLWQKDETGANVDAWANRPGMPEHLFEPGALEQADAVDRRIRREDASKPKRKKR